LQNFVEPPHDLPAAVRKKPYQAIHPGTGMLLNDAKAFLEDCYLPFLMKSKGGGQNVWLLFCCRRADCTLVCRLVPVPHAFPPLYIAEVNRNFSRHTNHNAEEYEQAQKLVLEPVLRQETTMKVSAYRPNASGARMAEASVPIETVREGPHLNPMGTCRESEYRGSVPAKKRRLPSQISPSLSRVDVCCILQRL
jgi:hypothetical protein